MKKPVRKKNLPKPVRAVMGRPTSYRPEYNEQVYKLCLLGAIDDELARFFEVSVPTLCSWFKKFPDFLKAVKNGREMADANVGKRLYERALGYSHPEEKVFCSEGEIVTYGTTKHYPPDTAAAFIWLKNRRPDIWRDRHEVTGANGQPLPANPPALVIIYSGKLPGDAAKLIEAKANA